MKKQQEKIIQSTFSDLQQLLSLLEKKGKNYDATFE